MKAEFEAIYRGSLLLASVDVICATICAAMGNARFVFFFLLGLAMWGYGMYFKKKSEEIGE